MDSEELKWTEPSDTPEEGTLVGGALDPESDFAPGANLGRYVVLSRMGSGGMGVVYASYDPQLDRRIALKLMHQRGADEEQAERASRRMLAEAKAMAQLSHPNVITVHDVGTIDRRVFIAMEFVEGVPLSEWMRQPERDWRQLLAVFTKAGRGLEAAHNAGLVHRDFKPDNVLVGADGRVRVLDFGLARRLDRTRERNDRRDREAGTPAYMSPEQHLGKRLDHRADQFSFCVALYEALYGEMPFAAKTRLELALAVTDGRVGPAPKRTGIPNWLRYVLLRGLDPDPEGRWDSMGELLTELSRDPTRPWPRILAWTGGVVASVALIATVTALIVSSLDGGDDEEPPQAPLALEQCAVTASESVAEVWDESRAGAIRAAFSRHREPWAQELGERAEQRLAQWAAAWETMHRESCEANVQKRQSDSMFDLRVLCLDQQLAEFGEFVAVLGSADAESLRRTEEALGQLPELASCEAAQLEFNLANPEPARSEEEQELLIGVKRDLYRAQSLLVTGAFAKSAEAASAGVAGAKQLADGSLLAQALLAQARVALAQRQHEQAVPLLDEAEIAAERAGADSLRGEILTELARVDVRYDDVEAAERHVREARAVLDRVGAKAVAYAELEGVAAEAMVAAGKLEDAREHVVAAIESLREVEPPPVELGRLRLLLGVILRELGEYEGAELELATARELWTGHYGEQHPIIGEALLEQGWLAVGRDDHEQAVTNFAAAQDLFAGAFGDSSLDVALASTGRGMCLGAMGRHDEALRALTRARSIFRAQGDAAAIELARVLDAEGVVQLARGEHEESAKLHRGALRELERAREQRGFHAATLIPVRVHLGAALLASAELPEARSELELALAGMATPRSDTERELQARARWLAAKVWAQGEDAEGERARELAEQARAAYLELGADARVGEIEAWLADIG